MLAAGPTQIHALFQADSGAGIDDADHGQNRSSLTGRPVQPQPPDGGLPSPRGHHDQP
jgi:hypothetical protein